MSVTPPPDSDDPVDGSEHASDRQRAGWGPTGEPTYDRRVEERRQVAADDIESDERRSEIRRADDRYEIAPPPPLRSDNPDALRVPSPQISAPPDSAASAGRLLAIVLVIIVAFAGGIAVDQAAWRSPETAFAPTFAPAPSALRPPSTARPTPTGTDSGSGAASASPATTAPASGVPGRPATEAPTPRATAGPTIGPGASVPAFAPANVAILWDVLKLITENFVRRDELNPTDLTYGAVSGLVDSLGDPGHTTFLTPDQVKSENEALAGEITGVGIFLGQLGDTPIVQSVVSGSPAAKAGILPGDRLIAIDGHSAENLSLEEIARLVRGPEGSNVNLTVIHPHGNAPVEIPITRQKITVPAVSWTMIPGTTLADIRVNQFSSGTTDQFTSAVRGARQAGATGIVLDLRNNPGGYVDDAVGVVSQLLPSGDVYIRRTADGKEIPVPVKSGGVATEIPLAVLVDYGSASSAEITAGALQDAGRAPLIGTRTYGTGTVLNTFNLPDGSAVRIGVEEWLTPKGREIFPNGVKPDQEVDISSDIPILEPDTLRTMSPTDIRASDDTQLLRAIDDLTTR